MLHSEITSTRAVQITGRGTDFISPILLFGKRCREKRVKREE